MNSIRPGRTAGKVVLISGAASGMGASHARFLAREGAKVVVTDLQDELGQQVVAEINAEIGEDAALYSHLDVTDFEQWKQVVATTVEHFGKLDALVNNAGVGAHGRVGEVDLETWHRAMNINLNGTFYGMRAALPELTKNSTSSIVNVSSIAGLFGFKHRAAYSASKWAVQGLTKTSAIDYGVDGVRVNSIHPGSVKTPLTENLKRGFDQVPQGRAAEAEEVSPLIVYLVSEESSFVNGANIAIDGGETAGNHQRPTH